MEPTKTVLELWTSAKALFRDNKEARTIYLDAEFHSFLQGDLSMIAYCQGVKTHTDALCDVGQPVPDRMRILKTLHDLNKRFSNVATIISMTVPFLMFATTCSMTLLQEVWNANECKVAAQPALLSTGLVPAPTFASRGSSSCQVEHGDHDDGSECSKNRNKYCRNKNKGDRSSNHGTPVKSAASTPFGPWVCINPWAP